MQGIWRRHQDNNIAESLREKEEHQTCTVEFRRLPQATECGSELRAGRSWWVWSESHWKHWIPYGARQSRSHVADIDESFLPQINNKRPKNPSSLKDWNPTVHTWKWALWYCSGWSHAHGMRSNRLQLRRSSWINCTRQDWVLVLPEGQTLGKLDRSDNKQRPPGEFRCLARWKW